MIQRYGAFINNAGATLWRFMDFTKYVAMLHRRAIFLARADELPDPFEGMFARRNHCEGSGQDSDEQHRVRRRACLSCWHENEHESAAMWRIYLNSEDGVAIRSSVARLESSLATANEDMHIGKVSYLDYARDPVPDRHRLDPFFCKRNSFDYEREVRVVWIAEDVVTDTGHYVAADLEKLIDKVIVSPTAERWFAELVESVTGKYGLELDIAPSSLLDTLRK
jgi:hypothetical protein